MIGPIVARPEPETKLITPGGVPGNLFGPTNPVESPESSELFGEPPATEDCAPLAEFL